MTALRTPSEISDRLDELKNNPIPDETVELNYRGWNVPEMQRQAKIEILEWMLDGWKSHTDLYRKYRQLNNTVVTFDEKGDRTAINLDAKSEALEWVMQSDPSDPRTFFERLDSVAEEVMYLGNDARAHKHDECDCEITPVDDTEFDAELLEEELHEIWRNLRTLRSHMLSDPADSPTTQD